MGISNTKFDNLFFIYFYLPRGSSYEDELGEEMGSPNCGQNPGHSGERVSHVGTSLYAERIKNVQQVVHVGIESGVALEIEVIRVDAAGADEIEENDSVVGSEVRQNTLPRRLVGAEAVREHQDPLAGPYHPDIKSLQQHVCHGRDSSYRGENNEV